ncbi:MAG: hypothetical protein HZA51_12220 [Planctomycetes bacterium]|nr:hypothetical protein [Planctomycetota bacterium]
MISLSIPAPPVLEMRPQSALSDQCNHLGGPPSESPANSLLGMGAQVLTQEILKIVDMPRDWPKSNGTSLIACNTALGDAQNAPAIDRGSRPMRPL